MMNIFEEAYRGIQEAKRAYAAATNTAEQEQQEPFTSRQPQSLMA